MQVKVHHTPQPLVVKFPDAMALLNLSRRTLELLIERGEVPKPFKLGKHRCWRRKDIEAFIDERAETAA
jgi:excisionase family DNA binding protein